MGRLNAQSIVLACALAAQAGTADGPCEEDPPGCNSIFVGVGITPLVDGEPTVGPVIPGDEIFYRVVAFLAPSIPPNEYCNFAGGQMLVTLPDGTVVELAGFAGTPDVPIVSFDTPFVIETPVSYTVTEADVEAGFIYGVVDFGGTVAHPELENPLVLACPPVPAAADAVSALPVADAPDDPSTNTWIAGDGDFEDDLNWDLGSPSPLDDAVFELEQTYTIHFNEDRTNQTLTIDAGTVNFNLQRQFRYELVGNDTVALRVGSDLDQTIMRVIDGTVESRSILIGSDPLALGRIDVIGLDTFLRSLSDLTVGDEGIGQLFIQAGGVVTSTFGVIGATAGGSGDISVVGFGPQLPARLEVQYLLIVNRGTLGVFGSGCVKSQFFGVLVLPDGEISGNGCIEGDVVNNGRVRNPGGLSIDGDYFQVSADPDFGSVSGSLDVRLGTDSFSQLHVDGLASLGGGLFVELDEGYSPLDDDAFLVLDASSVDPENPNFDVAVFPALDGDRFLRLGVR